MFLQVELLRLQLSSSYPELEIRSVDGFQGREKEAVVLSLVRSNPAGKLGFLTERRRLNVAVTRGRRQAAVVADAETVSKDPFLAEFVSYLREEGEVRSAVLYAEEVDKTELVRPEGMELTIKDGSSDRQRENRKKKEPSSGAKKKQRKQETKAANKVPEHSKVSIFKERHGEKEQGKGSLEDDEEEKEAKRKEFMEIIQEFIESERDQHKFPTNLNSHDRLVIHELAEELGLIHESVGEAKQRRIVVKKKYQPSRKSEVKSSEAQQPMLVEESSEHKEDVSAKDRNKDMLTCDTCTSSVPRTNIELHKLRCSGPKVPSTAETKKRPPKKPKGKKKSEQAQEEEDIDKLLASFDKLDNVCNGEGCKQKISVLGVTCDHCRRRFCLTHGLPEAHGCGDAARRAARMQISREGRLYSGSGRPDHKPDAVRRRQLEGKLGKKLQDMEGQRKTKKKEK